MNTEMNGKSEKNNDLLKVDKKEDEIDFFEIVDAKNPYWTNSNRDSISLDVLFAGFVGKEGYLPFNAMPGDIAAHGRLLYANAAAGAYGEVQPPPGLTPAQAEESINQLIKKASSRISKLNTDIETINDAIELDIAEEGDPAKLEQLQESLKAWKKYRVLLSRLNPEDAPDITFPEEPQS